jgi:hypothetical protein
MLVISATSSGDSPLLCSDLFEGNGEQKKFSITGINLSTDTVEEVRINGTLVSEEDYEFLSDNSIQFNIAPAMGDVIELLSSGTKVFEAVVFPVNTEPEDRIQRQVLYAIATRNDYTNVRVDVVDTLPGSEGDPSWVKLSTDNTNWFEYVELGTIKAGTSKRFYVKVEVPEDVPLGEYEDLQLEITGLEEITS